MTDRDGKISGESTTTDLTAINGDIKDSFSRLKAGLALAFILCSGLAGYTTPQVYRHYYEIKYAIFALQHPRHTETQGEWMKYGQNPVLGGKLGVCFDICVLREEGEYWMYFSWRPMGGIGLTKSADGIHWGNPQLVIGPSDVPWADIVNRPSVLKVPDGYMMWYTGQTRSQSFIGFATSHDGVSWSFHSQGPVLKPDQHWE